MKIIKKILLLVFAGMLLITCKKETLIPGAVENQPVFSFTGTINGTTMNWQAGTNNYYMYSTYKQDSGVYSFIGTLKNTSTANNSIQIIINDDTVLSTGHKSNIANSVTPSYYYYETPGGNPIWDSVIFTPKVNNPTRSFSYNFGDGSSASRASLTPVGHIYRKLQNYVANVSTTFDTGYPKSLQISTPVYLVKKSTPAVTVDSETYKITADTTRQHTLNFTANITGGTPPYSYIWDFGDNSTLAGIVTTSLSASISHTYTIEPAASYTVILAVFDSKRKDSAWLTDIVPDTNIKNNQMQYSISIPKPVPNPKGLANVVINYTDAQGNFYTSASSSQPLTSTFQITSVSNYQNNMYGNQTKMVKVTFSCILYNENNNNLPISGTAIIAVAYY